MAIIVHSPGRWVGSCYQLTSIFMVGQCIFGVNLALSDALNDISDVRRAWWVVASWLISRVDGAGPCIEGDGVRQCMRT
jgi:hypothetical protein